MLDDRVGLDPFAQRVVVRDNAMPQHGRRYALQIAYLRRGSPIQQGRGLGGGDQVLRGPWARAPGDILTHIIIRGGVFGTAGRRDRYGLFEDVLGDRGLIDNLVEALEVRSEEHTSEL